MQRLKGVAITEGTAAGRAVLLVQRGRAIRFPVPPDRVDEEIARLDRARGRSRTQLQSIKDRIIQGPGSELAPLFDAQLLILDDPMLVGHAAELIRTEHVNAEWAVQRAFDDIAQVFDAIEDPYLRERKGDVEDVVGRLRMNLHEGASSAPRDLLRDVEGPFVLIADELSPSVAAQIDWGRVRGFAMDAGSRTYHTAILARSLQIPAIVGLHDATARARAGDTVALDAASGELIIDPTPDVLRAILTRHRVAAHETAIPQGPATTTDGVCIRLEANVELPDDVAVAQRYGADGIGLFRSELLLAGESVEAISEEKQYAAYRKLVEAMAPRPVTIRTFDLEESRHATRRPASASAERRGGDAERGRSPLGLRGLRLGLARPAMLKRQLRAILRAAAVGPVRILLPFVSRVEELRAARTLLDAVAAQLRSGGMDVPDVPLGAMIEVPSAALIADLLAAEVEFLAIGTNDLIQYALAVDRTDERVSEFYRPLHPAMLRLLRLVRRAAARGRVPLSVCGEMASDPALLAVLIGLGLTDFSMTPGAIPGARRLIESVSAAELRAAARGALVLSTVEEIEDYLARAVAGIQQGSPLGRRL
jgi:phosphoenolpyruvate-protein phosphotransferase (PTS system enzyme I)